jgi:hypothetical protein
MKFLFCSLTVFLLSCEHSSNYSEALSSYQIEEFDGVGYYPFPDGVYAQYNDTRPSNSYKPDSILTAVKQGGTDIREAWDVQFHYAPNGNVYPAVLLYLRLRDSTQYVDTAYFHLRDKPTVDAKASIKHYYFK